MLSPAHLATVKDALVLKYLLEHGGELMVSYDELLKIGEEYHGWSIMLRYEKDGMMMRMRSPECAPR